MMLYVDPEERCSAAEVADHPWVAVSMTFSNGNNIARKLSKPQAPRAHQSLVFMNSVIFMHIMKSVITIQQGW